MKYKTSRPAGGRQMTVEMNRALAALKQVYPNEKEDHELLFRCRYGATGKPVCPKCKSKNLSPHTKGRQCGRCNGLVLSPTAGTYLNGVKAFNGWQLLALAYLYGKYENDLPLLATKKLLNAGTYNSIRAIIVRFEQANVDDKRSGLTDLAKAEMILKNCLKPSCRSVTTATR